MRHFVERYRYVAAVALSSMLLTGCGKLTPEGASETITLLRDGSQKICIAPDVQKTLHDLIVTKASDLSEKIPFEERTHAVAAVDLSYDMTTLKSFDASVAKATCNTIVKIGNGDKKNSFRVTYAISPAAEDANAFVITGDTADARFFATDLINDGLAADAAKSLAQPQEQETAQKQQQLLAMINEKWLTGTWIDANAAADNCGNGQAIWFEGGHVLEGVMGRGRWTLAKDQLHVVVGGFDKTGTIDTADAISFHVNWNDGSNFNLRRCTKAETETLPQTSDTEASQ